MENQFYIFGAGANGRQLLRLLDTAGIKVIAFIDNAKDKQGTKIEMLDCISLGEAVKRGAQDSIILISVAGGGTTRGSGSSLKWQAVKGQPVCIHG